MRKKILTICSSLFFLSLFSVSRAEERPYPCYRIDSPVIIDGNLDEKAWRHLPEAGGFYVLHRTDYAEGKQTFFKIGWDEKNIYLGITCAEPDVDKVKTVRADGDSLICAEDSIEVFLCPERPELYFQFMVNATGSRWNGKAPAGSYPLLGSWQAKCFKGGDFWSVEMRIPFSITGKAPAPGEKWRFNVCRNILTFDSGGNRYHTWALLQNNGFHDYQNFETLTFENKYLTANEALSIGRNVSSGFIQFVRGLLKNSLASAGEVISGIKSDQPEIKEKIDSYRNILLELEKVPAKKEITAREIWSALSKSNILESEIPELQMQQLLQ